MIGPSEVGPSKVEIHERVGINPIGKGCHVSCRESGNVPVASYTLGTRPFVTN